MSSSSKSCICCGKVKDLNEFYRHSKMRDGHLNKCKTCVKAYVKGRISEKRKDPEWLEKERLRGRIKAKKCKVQLGEYQAKHKMEFPEKAAARIASQRIEVDPGMIRHHWSYQDVHRMDIIEVEKGLHQTFHSRMSYDRMHMMYRSKFVFGEFPAGTLLKTKEMHIMYLNSIKGDLQ